MKRALVCRITNDYIDELRVQTRDQSLIDAYARWVSQGDKLDSLIRDIEVAFTGSTLGNGTGLLEANGLDDYAAKDELAELRSRDEHNDWRCIDVEMLNRCYTAPSFMNARGFVFHLPAFLIAELNDNFGYGFIDHLIDANRLPNDWMPLLNDVQRDAIMSVLSAIAEHPEYCDHAHEIAVTIVRLNDGRVTNG